MNVAFHEIMIGILSGIASLIPSGAIGIAVYVLSSLGLSAIAQRRGLRNPWLAWIPVARVYLLGSLSDQYRYVVHRENRSKRKVLLVLACLSAVLTVAVIVMGVMVAAGVVSGVMRNFHEELFLEALIGPLVGLVGISLPLCGVAIAMAVVRFMALYDVYKSLDPANSTLYLVLSILISPTEAFFLFFNRNKDDGMPPRRKPEQSQPNPQQEPQASAEQPAPDWQPAQDRPEPWEKEEPKDYL